MLKAHKRRGFFFSLGKAEERHCLSFAGVVATHTRARTLRKKTQNPSLKGGGGAPARPPSPASQRPAPVILLFPRRRCRHHRSGRSSFSSEGRGSCIPAPSLAAVPLSLSSADSSRQPREPTTTIAPARERGGASSCIEDGGKLQFSASCILSVLISDTDDSDVFDWDTDDEGEPSLAAALGNFDAPGPSMLVVDKDAKIKFLEAMGFRRDDADMAITRCGADASLDVLVDAISASQHEVRISDTDDSEEFKWDTDDEGEPSSAAALRNFDAPGPSTLVRQEMADKDAKIKFLEAMGFRRDDADMTITRCGVDASLDVLVDAISASQHEPTNRTLPEQASGRPFFYYENVAQAPKDTWSTISETLYGVKPEFVDSMHICATARKRGYVHNLPLENRLRLPLPPKTILDTFPDYEQWWPKWDERTKLNCLQTCKAPATVTERIQLALASSSSPPSPSVQKHVIYLCKKWNLVWTGKNKAVPLEPVEMERLLGFPIHHTRGASITERYKSLGNTFQVDTVTYHLSVLKRMFPNGMIVLSLFTGIGGAEVALHRLGIRLKAVVSVEKSEANRRIFKSWWDQTEQQGMLIEFGDVESLSNELIESHTRRLGGFDLVIGGSPCNNLAGSNRHHRDGLQGTESALFFQYFRILRTVKSVMATMREEAAARCCSSQEP
uniref:Uncharacterized protein n=1 Tax=Avena sativa TaxID=4498 RepID=A0ACD5ZA80_AVESA